MVQKYITEIEELRAKLCESEKLAEQLRKETAKAKRLSQTFSPATKLGTAWTGVGGVVDLNMEDDSGYSVQVNNFVFTSLVSCFTCHVEFEMFLKSSQTQENNVFCVDRFIQLNLRFHI